MMTKEVIQGGPVQVQNEAKEQECSLKLLMKYETLRKTNLKAREQIDMLNKLISETLERFQTCAKEMRKQNNLMKGSLRMEQILPKINPNAQCELPPNLFTFLDSQ